MKFYDMDSESVITIEQIHSEWEQLFMEEYPIFTEYLAGIIEDTTKGRNNMKIIEA